MSKNDVTNQQCANLCQVLNYLMKEYHITVEQLSRNTGVPPGTIKRIKNNKECNPTVTSLLPLATFFSVSLNQFLGLEPLPSQLSGFYKEQREFWRQVPIITWEAAITWPAIQPNFIKEFTCTDLELNDNPFALIVTQPDWISFPPGTILIVDPQKQPKHNSYVIYHKLGETKTNMKHVLVDDGALYLTPMNKTLGGIQLNADYAPKGCLVQIRRDIK
jgi:SOS-response transcriptional repressor LexA